MKTKTTETVEERVIRVVIDALILVEGAVTAETEFAHDLNADRFHKLLVLDALQIEFSLEISDEAVDEWETVQDAIDFVSARVEPRSLIKGG